MSSNRNLVEGIEVLLVRYPNAIRRTLWRDTNGVESVSTSHPAYHVNSWDDCDTYRDRRKIWSVIEWEPRRFL